MDEGMKNEQMDTPAKAGVVPQELATATPGLAFLEGLCAAQPGVVDYLSAHAAALAERAKLMQQLNRFDEATA